MQDVEFLEWVMAAGQISVPLALLDNLQALNLTPEDLGCLLLALAASQKTQGVEDLAKNTWIKQSLGAGWTKWVGLGLEQKISWGPLWHNLYQHWQKQQVSEEQEGPQKAADLFNYSKIVKWLDQARGTFSVTLQEKKLLQEFNLQYGWSADFILIFLQLCFSQGQNTVARYRPIAQKVYFQGVQTVDELVAFMNDLDWTHYQVKEVKKCVGQYGGVTHPQREMYLKWVNQWKFGHEVIMRAAEETVRTNSPSFKYIDGILKDWHEKDVKNVVEAEKALQEHDQKKKKTVTPQGFRRDSSRRRVSRTDQRDWEKMLGIE